MKVKFFTLGCKVNQYETQALKEEFDKLGYNICDDDKADIYVINTCSVTERADRKSCDAILAAKKDNPFAKIVVTGCLAELNEEKIRQIGVDYIVPQSKKHLLTSLVCSKTVENNKNIWSFKINNFENQRAFLKIQDGCDFYCSFCKIPYIRGRSISRDKDDIVSEFTRLARFHKEIVLCGINLALYGKDLSGDINLCSLLDELLNLNLSSRIRLSSLEPNLINDCLLKFFSHPKICPHLHLPFQSGDDRILKKMNKKETVSLYYDIVSKLRKINPSIAISCDIMVGFPEEDENSFNNTVEFLKSIKPMRMHIFRFSPRQPTPLGNFKLKGHKIIYQRYKFLKNLAFQLSMEYKKNFVGKTLDVITEEKEDSYITGHTQNYIKVYLKGNYPLGEIIPVKIVAVDNSGKVFGEYK